MYKLLIFLGIFLISSAYVISVSSSEEKVIYVDNNLTVFTEKEMINYSPSPYFNYTVNYLTYNYEKDYLKVQFDRDYTVHKVTPTGSMYPTISDNSQVILIKPTKNELNIGDIISFKCNKDYPNMLHRIRYIVNDTYFTQGDNNLKSDLEAFNCSPKFEDINFKLVGILY